MYAILVLEAAAVHPTLPLSGRQGAWGSEVESWWGPVHSRGLLGIALSNQL